jgi:hypothetical protein
MFASLFMLKEAFHSEKMEGVIPENMTFTEYVVRLLARKRKG